MLCSLWKRKQFKTDIHTFHQDLWEKYGKENSFFWNLHNSFNYYLYLKGIDAIFSVSDKTRTSMMKIDGVFTVLDEAPGKLANAILLFTKGMYLSRV